MAKSGTNGQHKKTLQSSISKEEYENFQKLLRKVRSEQKLNITESAYIRKLILEATEKVNST